MIRASQFGNRWPVVPLVEAVEFLDYKRRPVTESDRNPGPYPYYGANGIQGMVDGFIFDEPLVLVAEDGGHFGSAERTIAYQVRGKCWVNNHAHVLRPKPNTDINYLTRVLEQYDVTPLISGTTRGKLTKGAASNIEIPLPPLPDQKRIAAILDKADAIRRKRNQALRLTDDFLRSVFLDMFGTTENPSCPRIAVGDLIRFMTSGGRGWATYYADEGSRFLRSMDVRMNYIGDSDAVFVAAPDNAEAKRTMVQSGDVLLTITGSLIGRVAPVPAHLAGAFISQHVAILRLSQVLPSKFVAWALSVEEGQRQIQSLQSGQVKPGLNFDQIRKLKVPHPSLEKVCDFLAIVEVAQRKQASDQRQANTAETLFSSLQQRAFSGQL